MTKIIQNSLLYISFLLPFFILYKPDLYSYSGILAYSLLFIILIIRPLTKLFKKKHYQKISLLIKNLGIICGMLSISHVIGYFQKYNLSFWEKLFSDKYWNWTLEYSWGVLALILTIILLITSNILAIKILKKYWKILQRICTYSLFITLSIHAFLSVDKLIYIVLPILFVIIRFIAFLRVVK